MQDWKLSYKVIHGAFAKPDIHGKFCSAWHQIKSGKNNFLGWGQRVNNIWCVNSGWEWESRGSRDGEVYKEMGLNPCPSLFQRFLHKINDGGGSNPWFLFPCDSLIVEVFCKRGRLNRNEVREAKAWSVPWSSWNRLSGHPNRCKIDWKISFVFHWPAHP